MVTASLRRLDLTSFKTFEAATLQLDDVTVLTGRNSAGKSNALDALEVLSRLATGDDLSTALDGRGRESSPVRGGALGCAPHGKNSFALGCEVGLGNSRYRYAVTVQVAPLLRVTGENLWGPAPAAETGVVDGRWLLYAAGEAGNGPGLRAEVYNGRRGPNPLTVFRDDRLLITQLAARPATDDPVEAAILRAAEAVTKALAAVFHLDPVPHLMRAYVPARDAVLRRTGENLSAAIARLRENDAEGYARVVAAARNVADRPITGIDSVGSSLGDVMLTLREQREHGDDLTPAREMSDGLLRFLAVATAMLTAGRSLDIDTGQSLSGVEPGVLLVVEEVENGLHPSQADQLLKLLRDAAAPPRTKVLVTSHSPALLNALTGKLNRSVISCYRDRETGSSQLTRLVDLPGYATALLGGDIGDAVTRDLLVRPLPDARVSDDFDSLLGSG